ncbi:hypothetical protein PINS_up000632 [Pythium insidiosum]|nr:hypothetical protein PINS_up000632 [Pythium insidiosum]
MFPSSRAPPLVSPLTAMAAATAATEVSTSGHSYHPQHPVLGTMPPAYSTATHGYHDGALPPAFVPPLTMASSASYHHHHHHPPFATSYADECAAPKKPKRKRKYTDATRAKHREVQRRFILRKKVRSSTLLPHAITLSFLD